MKTRDEPEIELLCAAVMKNDGGTAMVLFINACVRRQSRTLRLAKCLLEKLGSEAEELRLDQVAFPVADEAFLEKRDHLIAAGDFNDPLFAMARQFAAADIIVIAAPYWDLSFPAALKQYIEQINVLGITFAYTAEGIPQGLCKARKLCYVTTAGGSFVPEEFGFGYVRTLAQNFYGIPEVELIQAAGLDIDGADDEGILRDAIERIRSL